VRGIERNRVIVAPGRAGLIWRVGRWSPPLVRLAVDRAMRAESRAATATTR
jgi:hypothetical protein